MFKKISIFIFSVLMPSLTFAAAQINTGYIDDAIKKAGGILRGLVGFLVALAVVWFIWNVIKYTMSEEEDGKEKARKQMYWGIVAIAVCVSVWGLVALLQTIFLGGNGGSAQSFQINNMIPNVPGARTGGN